ncbi:MAG: alpha-glucuronidase [Cyanobacteria bacterium REEB67]|nr:alpha-glucuronidase [Cyanobacteria bacterium REEB67]
MFYSSIDSSKADTKNAAATNLSRRSFLALSAATLTILQISHPANAAGKILETKGRAAAGNEDGYRTWLRYEKIDEPIVLRDYTKRLNRIVVEGQTPTCEIVRAELSRGLSGLLGAPIEASSFDMHNERFADAPAKPGLRNSLLVLTASSPLLHNQISAADLRACGPEGFIIRSLEGREEGGPLTLIAANSEIGTLYGAFAFLRLLQTRQSIEALHIQERPRNARRILAHSDNTYAAVDRGYSGKSLWHWQDLPGAIETIKERLQDYSRINASIGINGVIINKVEADPAFIATPNLPKLVALADLFRPYGMRLYVSANFASPIALGGLHTADPLDETVRHWWQEKADEIYRVIPDFGGLEVKVNSEGMTGPENYGRSHADGANMMAAAFARHGGIVMWRAFVYDFPNKNVNEDRVKRAYLEFQPLDGLFADNVLVQAKNGPLDFQPREPYHPLFGAMPKTRMLGELQLNQEYLGQATHLVYLGTMWEEFLQAETGADHYGKRNPTVADVIECGPDAGGGGFSATSNVGDDRNWTGHHFDQANWFAYGRLAWNANLTASAIASDWIKMTWSHDSAVVDCIHKMMMGSHEAFVSYSMPLGLHHMVGGDHYAPMPEGYGDPRGMFHHADRLGIGYDRTREGSDAVDQYFKPLSDNFNAVHTCPEKYLLWFHHLPWHHPMRSGRSLWQELCFKYQSGAAEAEKMKSDWAVLAPFIDSERHADVAAKLKQQAIDAAHWRDHCLGYFAAINKLTIG